MAKKEHAASDILESIRNKEKIIYDAYIDLYQYFTINSANLSNFDILGGSEIEITDEGISEKEMAVAEKRAAMMAKFSEKYDYYVTTLEKLRNLLDEKTRERAEQEVEFANKSGVSVEERIFKKRG